jgi:hypothetical protein
MADWRSAHGCAARGCHDPASVLILSAEIEEWLCRFHADTGAAGSAEASTAPRAVAPAGGARRPIMAFAESDLVLSSASHGS